VERNNAKYAAIQRRDVKLLNASVVDKMPRAGLVVNRVDPEPFRARLRPYFEFWANEFGSTEWGLLQNALGRKLV
jgi:TRAP-type transport system periplasmic protein